jgi:hypothetical protein
MAQNGVQPNTYITDKVWLHHFFGLKISFCRTKLHFVGLNYIKNELCLPGALMHYAWRRFLPELLFLNRIKIVIEAVIGCGLLKHSKAHIVQLLSMQLSSQLSRGDLSLCARDM